MEKKSRTCIFPVHDDANCVGFCGRPTYPNYFFCSFHLNKVPECDEVSIAAYGGLGNGCRRVSSLSNTHL